MGTTDVLLARPGRSASETVRVSQLVRRSASLTATPLPVGGIIAVFAFLAKDAPKYVPGYSICIAFIGLSLLSCTVYFFGVGRENRRRDALQAQGAYDHISPEERKEMGDLDPDYRYFR